MCLALLGWVKGCALLCKCQCVDCRSAVCFVRSQTSLQVSLDCSLLDLDRLSTRGFEAAMSMLGGRSLALLFGWTKVSFVGLVAWELPRPVGESRTILEGPNGTSDFRFWGLVSSGIREVQIPQIQVSRYTSRNMRGLWGISHGPPAAWFKDEAQVDSFRPGRVLATIRPTEGRSKCGIHSVSCWIPDDSFVFCAKGPTKQVGSLGRKKTDRLHLGSRNSLTWVTVRFGAFYLVAPSHPVP